MDNFTLDSGRPYKCKAFQLQRNSEMRRKEQEITDRAAIESIIAKSTVCRLALSTNDRPYIVPLCFGYADNALYFHTAREGKKIDILKKNNRVCFEVDCDNELVSNDTPCKWSMRYRSVVGFGKASVIDDPESKRRALDIVMQHYGGQPSEYSSINMEKMLVIKVEIESMTGKYSGCLE
jgi:nitroimidazol reductase NimA-like FMN-containing flavoprotein (pyridoxamine 5'-phosphate oxidase superfamily)